jgi:hypothetical protein
VFPHQNGVMSLDTPAERARFVAGANSVRHMVDVDSLVVSSCEATCVDEHGRLHLGVDVRNWRYVAELHGGFAEGEAREGQRFFVRIEFVHGGPSEGRPAQLTVESLRVGIESDGSVKLGHLAGDITVDLTQYDYPSGVDGGKMLIANFPLEWRQWLANRAMLLCLVHNA